MKSFLSLLIFFLIFCTAALFAQEAKPGIAILDLSERNEETNDSRLFSVEHICNVVGLPFVITQDMAEAATYKMVLCTSALKEQTFEEDEETALIDYVENGGLLLAPRVEDEDLFALFGVESYESSNARYTMTWDNINPLNEKELCWINEPEELTMSLGRDSYDAIFKTLGYTTSTGKALAHFIDGTAGVVANDYGDGHTVAIGLSLKEIVLRNQINRDYEAQRITSNGFEPTMDVLFLFVRAWYAKHQPFSVWKHTSPGNSSATVMVTHDIDSKTGMDTLRKFVDYEQLHNIEATYNVTVRYFDDELMSPFYLDQQSTLDYIGSHGQAFGSHSVGHFFDFADEDVFPIGETGETPNSYQPYNDGDITIGGSIYGECEVSKNVLEEDCGVNIRTFRAGHLAYPKYLINVLEEIGYAYNSTYSASDVLTNFPYQNKKGRSFSGERSSVYEIPVTISDVFHADPISPSNYLDKSNTWLDITMKNRANGAPTVLLIHPNRGYKLTGMAYYLENLPGDICIKEMARFGDYWRAREQMDFNFHVFNNEMTILLPGDINLEDNISFIVNDGQSLDNILVKDAQNNILEFTFENWEGNDVIVFHQGVTTSDNIIVKKELKMEVFPNPTEEELSIKFELAFADQITIDLFDLKGEKVLSILDDSKQVGEHQLNINLKETSLIPGVYFVVGQTSRGAFFRKKVVFF